MLALLAAALVFAVPVGAGASDPLSPGDAWLEGLKGEWIMSGTVHAKPVKYHAWGERVLRGAFMRLHMIDAAPAPEYEA